MPVSDIGDAIAEDRYNAFALNDAQSASARSGSNDADDSCRLGALTGTTTARNQDTHTTHHDGEDG